MTAKYFLVLGCLALSQGALVKREAPNFQEDIQNHAAEFQKTFSEQLAALVNSENSQDWQKSLKEGSDSVLTQLTSLTSSLQGVMTDATGKAKEALQASQANLKKTADELRAAHPEIEEQATSFKDKLSTAVQNALQETQNLAKELAANAEETNKKLAPKVKEAYDDFVKHAQDLQKKLHDAANKQ